MRIKHISAAFPDNMLSSAEVSRWVSADEQTARETELFLTEKVGIYNRPMLSEDEGVTDLAEKAVRNLLAERPDFKIDDVGLMVVVTQNPDYALPHTSALLHARLGVGRTCAAFDISLGCSGWVYALSIVRGFMQSENIENALLVTCDPYSKAFDKADRDVSTIFGDAASATWLSASEGAVIGKAVWGTDGSMADYLIKKAGGSKQPLWDAWRGKCEWPDADYRIHMNGRGILTFALGIVAPTIDECIKLNGLGRDDIDLYVLHQANKFMLENMIRRIDLPPEKVPILVENIGNTVSSSIPCALHALGGCSALAGKTVLVSGFGVGLSWGTGIIKF